MLMNVLSVSMVVMEMRHAPTLMAVIFAHATEHSPEMAEIVQVSRKYRQPPKCNGNVCNNLLVAGEQPS